MTTLGVPPTPEPSALREDLRARVVENPASWPGLAADGTWLAAVVWPEWAAALTGAGVTETLFTEVIAGYRGELWLWVMGERTWAQVAAGLVGRAMRRRGGRGHGWGCVP